MKMVNCSNYNVLPDTKKDCTQLFVEMFNQNMEDTKFILKEGRYDFYCENAIQKEYYLSNSNPENPRKLAMLLKKMKNIVFDGNDSEFIFHGQVLPITVDECENVTIKNITIDWDIPLTAEGVITNSDKKYVDVSIDNDKFPHEVCDKVLYFTGENWKKPVWQWGNHEYDIHTKKITYRSGDTFPKTTQELLENGDVRFHGNFNHVPQVGNYLVLRHNDRIHSGIFIANSKNISVENVTIHCTGGLGVLAQFCDTLNFKKIKMIPNEKKGRMFSSGHDDGIHLSCNMGHISVEECYFYGLLDDPLNIHGIATRIIEKIDDNTLLCEFAHSQAIGFSNWALKGHEISFIDSTTLESVKIGKVAAYKLLTTNTFKISFEDKISDKINVGDALENLTRTASITLKNNFFGNCRARGILLTTPKEVLVLNNIFESAGAGILIAGDANHWYESGNSKDVTIKNNVFGDSCITSEYQGCEGVICIHPEIDNPDKNIPFHRNIKIIDNVFNMSDIPLLYAISTRGLTFENNNIFRSYTYKKWHDDSSMFNFNGCSKVAIKNNRFVGDVQGRDIAYKGMDKEDIEILQDGIVSVLKKEQI